MQEQQVQKKPGRFVKIFGYCVNKLWLMFAFMIVLIALLHVLLNIFLPQINRYQPEIVDWLENRYQLNIDVEKISAEWGANGPILELTELKIRTNSQSEDFIQVGKVSIYLDIITSLWNWRLSTEEIAVDNANITFRINQALGVELPLENLSDTKMDIDGTSSKIFDILFGQKALSLTDSSLKLLTLSGTEFVYHINQLKILKYEEIHQLTGQLENSKGGTIQLITEVYGDPAKSTAYSEVYLQGEGIDISNLPWPDEAPVKPPKAGELSWEFWGTWKNQHWASASANMVLSDALWSDLISTEVKNNFQTLLSWDHSDSNDGFLSAHHSVVTIGVTDEQSISDVFLKYNKTSSKTATWSLTMEEFEMNSIVSYLSKVVEYEHPLTNFISNTNLSLKLDRFHVDISKQLGVWQAPELSLKFSELSYEPWNNIPRLNGLTGKIHLTSDSGIAAARAQDTKIEISNLFRQAIDVDLLDSLFTWNIQQEIVEQTVSANRSEKLEPHFTVRMLNGKLSNKDLAIQAQAEWFTQDQKPVFSLYSELTNVKAKNQSLYLPVGTMSSNLVNYLDRSVKGGTFTLIKSAVRGPTSLFPFADEEGYFAVLGFLKNATYQYLPEWPETTQLDTKLKFVGNGMDIIVNSAESMGNQVKYARAVATDLSIDNPILKLSLDIESTDNLGRLFLQKSPLTGIASSLAEVDFDGIMRSKINLSVGLGASAEDKAAVKGVVKLEPSDANINTPYINITNLDGEIRFDQNSVLKSDLTADYQGNKLAIEMTGQRNPDDPTLTIKTSGLVTHEGVSEFLDLQWSQFFNGETQINSNILFSPSDHPGDVWVEVTSDMVGMAFELPDSVGKLADESRVLSLSLKFGEESKGKIKWDDISADWYWARESKNHDALVYPEISNSELNTNGVVETKNVSPISSEVEKGLDEISVNYGARIYINKASSNANNERIREDEENIAPGISISGGLANANLNGWIDFVNRLNDEELTDNHSSEDEDSTRLLVNSIDLEIGIFDLNIANFDNVQINLSKEIDQSWRANLTGPQVKMDLILNELKPWQMAISKLDLTLNEEFTTHDLDNKSEKDADYRKAEEADRTGSILPSDLFDMDISCEVCAIQGKQYGKILAELRKINEGAKFQGTISNKEKHNAVFSGNWVEIENQQLESPDNGIQTSQKGPVNGTRTKTEDIAVHKDTIEFENTAITSVATETTLNFELVTDDIGKLLERWDINPSVKDSSGTLVAETKWQDAPWNFEYSNASANMQLHLNRGYLSEISDGSGRLFSLFNLQSLIRKITFDFKDVYQKGFFYDSIDGTLQLSDGIISTENVSVVGNVADVRMYGKTNLRDETIEQMAIITPHLTSSLPVLAAWAIEPTTGLIVYIINKLMEPAVEVATQIDYRIHGTFDEVTVDQISSSKKKIKIEYETEVLPEDSNKDEQTISDEVAPKEGNGEKETDDAESKEGSKSNHAIKSEQTNAEIKQ